MSKVWDWYHATVEQLRTAGERRVADVLDQLPGAALDARPDLPALVAEGKAGAERLGHPWLAVFVRHWELQGRHAEGGEEELALAVDAIERAHRPEAVDCPQTVCTAQDLGLCFERVDAVGYAEPRHLAAAEGIARIDATWECFRCLTSEQSSALVDLGRPDEALALVQERMAQMAAAGGAASELEGDRAGALLALGDPEGALVAIERRRESPDFVRLGRSTQQGLEVDAAAAHLMAGRVEEAAACLPPPGDLPTGHSNAVRWAHVHLALTDHDPERNTAELADVLWHHLEAMSERGAHRPSAALAVVSGELARRRGVPWRVDRARDLAERHQAQLRAPLDESLRSLLEGLEAWLADPHPCPAPVPPDELVALIEGSESATIPAEQVLTWVAEARRARPEDPQLVVHQVVAGLRCALAHAEVVEVAWTHLEEHAADAHVGAFVAFDAARRDAERDLERLEALVGEVQPETVWWGRANLAFGRGEHEEVVAQCARIVEHDPGALNTRRLWAASLLELDRPAEAAALRSEVVSRLDPDDVVANEVDRWRLMEALALAADRRAVREVANELGMDVEVGDEPWAEQWGPIIVEMGSPSAPHRYHAERTGPVTARIIEVDPPGAAAQRSGAEVVFHASPLEPFPEAEEDQQRFVPTYAHVGTIQASDRVAYEVEGVDPGPEAWLALMDALREVGHVLWVVSSGYPLEDRDSGEQVPGVYALLAVANDADRVAVDRLLRTHVDAWEQPVVWPMLAAEAGHGIDEALAVVERFALAIPVPVEE